MMTADEIHEAWLRSHGIVMLPPDPKPITPEQTAAIEADLARAIRECSDAAHALTQHLPGAGRATP